VVNPSATRPKRIEPTAVNVKIVWTSQNSEASTVTTSAYAAAGLCSACKPKPTPDSASPKTTAPKTPIVSAFWAE